MCGQQNFAASIFALLAEQEPSQQRTLNKLLSELRSRNFANEHRLSILIGAKCAKTLAHCVCISTELPFCMPTVGGWESLMKNWPSPQLFADLVN